MTDRIFGFLVDENWLFEYAKSIGMAPQPPEFGSPEFEDEVHDAKLEAAFEASYVLRDDAPADVGMRGVWIGNNLTMYFWTIPTSLRKHKRTPSGEILLQKIRKHFGISPIEEPQFMHSVDGPRPAAFRRVRKVIDRLKPLRIENSPTDVW